MGITKEAQEYLINVEKQRLKLLKGPGGQDSASGFVEDQRREGKRLAGQADGNKFQRIAQNRLRGSAKSTGVTPAKRPVSGAPKKVEGGRPRWLADKQETRVNWPTAVTRNTGTAVKVAKRAAKSRFRQGGK